MLCTATGADGASDSGLILGQLSNIHRPNLYPLEGEKSCLFFGCVFLFWFIFSCKFMCIMRKESSCQIFAGICNTKELMSPLCHLLCNTKQMKRESACWLHGSPGCTGLTGDGRAALPSRAPAELHCCVLRKCPGLYLHQECAASISAEAQLWQGSTRAKEAILLPDDES